MSESKYNKSISNQLIDKSIPKHIHADDPQFIAFVKAFYEWLEQEKNPLDILMNLKEYRSIDETIDEFVDFFRKEYLFSIPTDIVSDKRLLAKQIKNFYMNKGNEASYSFLFNLLFGVDIQLYYPRDDILRASDGKWNEQKSIKILAPSDIFDIQFFQSNRITGNSSNTIAIIDSVVKYTERSRDILEIFLNDIRGNFLLDESVSIDYIDQNQIAKRYTTPILDSYTSINLTEPGSGYISNTRIPVKDKDDITIGSATITSVIKGGITSLNIIEDGINYNGDFSTIDVFGDMPLGSILDSTYLLDYALDDTTSSGDIVDLTEETTVPDYTRPNNRLFSFPVNSTISDVFIPTSEISSFGTYTLESIITDFYYPGVGDIVNIKDRITIGGGTGGFGRITEVDGKGRITEVTLLASGSKYEDPYTEIVSLTGSGGEIGLAGGAGAISKIRLDSFPLSLPEDFDVSNNQLVYIDFSNYGSGDALATLNVGTLGNYPGYWLNDDGKTSSTKYIQDNKYYQDFSYVIRSGISSDKWMDIVKKIIHPAGLALFGEVAIESNLLVDTKIISNIITIQ